MIVLEKVRASLYIPLATNSFQEGLMFMRTFFLLPLVYREFF